MVQARHLFQSMSVKSSVARCLSSAVAKVHRNCLERILDITVIKYFWNDTLERRKSLSSNCSIIPLFLNKKVRMKTRNIMTPSYHPRATSTQNKRVLLSFFVNSSLPILVDVQRLHENGKLNFMYF